MNIDSLRKILNRLGIKYGRPKNKKDKYGRPIQWTDFECPLAPYLHESGRDSRPSAGAIAIEGGNSIWSCHTCKSSGRITSLIRQLEQFREVHYPGLMREAEEADIGIPMSEDFGKFEDVPQVALPLEPLVEEVYYGLFPPASNVPEAMYYLQECRKSKYSNCSISTETADSLGLLWDEGQRRILFPVRDDKNLLYGFTGRAIDAETQPRVKDYYGLPKRSLILGQERWVHAKPVLIVEGLFAYAHLVSIGAEKFFSIGALLGSELTEDKAKLLKLWDEPVFLLLDNDTAGDDGIFGRRKIDDKGVIRREKDTGAIARLSKYLMVYVPLWPLHEDNEPKNDPDQLTLEEVEEIFYTTDIFSS